MRYNSLNNYLRNKFGCKVYKLSISSGLSCPNRDGKLSTKGCIFCSNGGSGDFATSAALSVTEQIKQAKEKVSKKITNGKYIAYFQSFTNTYGDVDYLKKIFTEAINHPDIVALSIGTRPDCLPNDILDLLNRLNQIKPVWVELGLQTIHEKTARYINRGYTLDVFDQAVENLNKLNIDVIVHLILGLPNETNDMILESVKYVCSKPISGIKLQLLHVLKNTPLEKEYFLNQFHIYSLEEYASLLGECICNIPSDIVIHRLTGDGPKSLLIEPQWSGNKKLVLNYINKYFNDMDIIQGKYL
ncbi:MAG: TIGR01212 family radical SAM protein [Eubacterium sp.]|uniref:TIGR01212 family radical SAM protein n=1 Tax=Eubacterium sp. TaxID=142586 RepID=UPI00261B3DDC|nr:TIGR01212 family radical SAM protein [uncultured Eubacterium sp.]